MLEERQRSTQRGAPALSESRPPVSPVSSESEQRRPSEPSYAAR